jgi:arabinofuranosyltransferase
VPISRRDLAILAFSTLLVMVIYLLFSIFTYRIGFPLDDSWIHQTYARNLAFHHEWSFFVGQPSAGSTSPLWTFLLSIGFFLPLAPYLWAYLLGGLLLFGLAILIESIVRSSLTGYAPAFPWGGLFFIIEWHMSWAAVSGMETLLYIVVVVAMLGLLIVGSRRFALMGLLIGVSVWIRPDGLTLLGPLVCYSVLAEKSIPTRIQALFRGLLSFLALFLPYILFNLVLSGTPLPNTFYAKQAEYLQWQSQPIPTHLLSLLVNFFAGPSLMLLWFFIKKVRMEIRARQWGLPLSSLWLVGFCLLYISRLPVYQHGRYLMPALSVFLLIGSIGLIEFLPSKRTYRSRLARQAILTATALFSLAFGGYGAALFGQDVAFVESEMVDTAKWVAQNLPTDAVIASHDIGALGFFGQHQIIDLAGLISPEVIPFIRDETRLAAFMNEREVDYLITFPAWYPILSQRGQMIYSTSGHITEPAGTDHMSVYLWRSPLP